MDHSPAKLGWVDLYSLSDFNETVTLAFGYLPERPLSISSNDYTALTSYGDNASDALLCNYRTGEKRMVYREHKSFVYGLCVVPELGIAATSEGSIDSSLHIWDLETGRTFGVINVEYKHIAWSGKYKKLLGIQSYIEGGGKSTIDAWDLINGKLSASSACYSAANDTFMFSEQHDLLISGAAQAMLQIPEGNLLLWNLKELVQAPDPDIHDEITHHTGKIAAVYTLGDDSYISISLNGEIWIRNMENKVIHQLETIDGIIKSHGITLSGNYLIVKAEESEFDFSSGRPVFLSSDTIYLAYRIDTQKGVFEKHDIMIDDTRSDFEGFHDKVLLSSVNKLVNPASPDTTSYFAIKQENSSLIMQKQSDHIVLADSSMNRILEWDGQVVEVKSTEGDLINRFEADALNYPNQWIICHNSPFTVICQSDNRILQINTENGDCQTIYKSDDYISGNSMSCMIKSDCLFCITDAFLEVWSIHQNRKLGFVPVKNPTCISAVDDNKVLVGDDKGRMWKFLYDY
jgi:WD40 repeat protein